MGGVAAIGPVDIEFAMANINFTEEMNKMKQQIAGISSTAQREANATNNSLASIGKAVGAYLTASQMTKFAGDVAGARGEMQQLQVSLETMLKSKSKADALTSQMVQLAATTPFELKDVAQGGKQLLAYGTSAKDITKTLTMLGDVAAGTSQPLGDLVYLYGTSQVQGRLFARDIMQFSGRGIPVVAELAKVLGVSKEKVSELVEKGKVGFKELEKAFKSMTGPVGQFGGLMEKQSHTINGQLSNLKDAWFQAMNDMGAENEGFIYGVIKGTNSLVNNWREVADVITVVAATWGAYKAATMVVSIMNEVEAAGSLTAALQKTAVAQGALNLVQKASPAGMVLVGITALIGAYVAWERHASRTSEAQEAINKAVSDASVKANYAFEAVKRTAAGTKEHAEAIKIVNDRYGDYLANLLTEKSSLDEVEAAQRRVTQAVMADAGAKAVKGQLDKVLSDYSSSFNKQMDDYVNDYTTKYGADRAGEITQALQDAVNKAASNGSKTGQTDKSVMNEALTVYNKYLKGATDFWKFRDDFEKAVKDKSKLDPELTKLQSQKDSYEKLLETNKKPDAPVKETKEFDKDGFKKDLEEKKKAYELYYKWVETMGEDTADKQYKTLIAGGKSYREYLLNQIGKLESKGASANNPQLFAYKNALAEISFVKKPFEAFKEEVQGVKDSSANLVEYIQYLDEQLTNLGDNKSEAALQKRVFLNEEKTKAQRDNVKQLIEDYNKLVEASRSYQSQIADIEGKYGKDEAMLNQHKNTMSEEDYNNALAMLNKNKTDEINAVKDKIFQESAEYKRLTGVIEAEGRKALVIEIANLEAALNKAKEVYGEQSQEYKKLKKDLSGKKNDLKLFDSQQIDTALSGINSLAGAIGGTLGSSIQQSISGFGNLKSGISDLTKEGAGLGDSIAGVTGIFSGLMTVGSIIGSLFEDDDTARVKAYYETQETWISWVNKDLEKQLSLLKEIKGEQYVSASETSLKQVEQDQTDIVSKLQNISLLTGHHSESTGLFGLGGKKIVQDWTKQTGKSIEYFKQMLEDFSKTPDEAVKKYGVITKDDFKLLQDYVDAYDKAVEQAKEIQNQLNEELTGTTYDSIVDSLKSAFDDGTLSATEFADNFQELMKNAVLNSFSRQYLQTQLQGWYDEFSTLSKDGLSADDMAKLKEAYKKITTDAQAGINQLSAAAGIDLSTSTSSSSSSLSGAVASVSQETASVVAGQMNAMRINQAESLKKMDASLMSLTKIEVNTGYLIEIYGLLKNDSLRAKGL